MESIKSVLRGFINAVITLYRFPFLHPVINVILKKKYEVRLFTHGRTYIEKNNILVNLRLQIHGFRKSSQNIGTLLELSMNTFGTVCEHFWNSL